MLGNIGFLTYLAAGSSFAVLTLLLLLQWRAQAMLKALLLACSATTLWAAVICLGTLWDYPPVTLIRVAELARNAAWLYLLVQLLSLRSDGTAFQLRGRDWRGGFLLALLASAALLLAPVPARLAGLVHDASLVLWLALSLLSLLLIEQLYRNADGDERWSLKFLCLGLGALFIYDFYMYSDALLFRALDPELWQARGLVAALTTPWLAIAIARNSSWQVDLHISRQVVFHTVTLMGAGTYLLSMAVIGYFIKYLGGGWGTVLQLAFLFAAGCLLLALLFSGRLRAMLRVQLSKHFFSYRYDYREEWLKFTRALAGLSSNVPEGIIRVMARLALSPGGLLWRVEQGDSPQLLAHWQLEPPADTGEGLGNLGEWLKQTDWVIDLREWRAQPDLYYGLQLPRWLEHDERLWLVIPLRFREQVEGILMLQRSEHKGGLNWEDRDLLKTAGRQAATHLAQHLAAEALMDSRQFEAFNRLSAYVIHDLKNILAQQSLMVANAARHRDNPAFVDDMITTVDNSVQRMRRLMEQMRQGERSESATLVNLGELLTQVAKARSDVAPAPELQLQCSDCIVEANAERLATVFTHLVQNAQEATPDRGRVTLRLCRRDGQALIDVEDNGSGMDEAFLRERLFRPFQSTKGLTGMGIGTFESRDYIRQLGGDIRVRSQTGQGTCFSIVLPLREDPVEQPEQGLVT